MSDAPVTDIDLAAFTADPYPVPARMRRVAPITQVALPMALAAAPGLRLATEVKFTGWAFRAPRAVSVAWDARKALSKGPPDAISIP